MSAGAIRAPLIIPLRVPPNGVPKSRIDSNTRLEILSETPNVNIYFTINGSRPVIAKSDKELLNTGTYKFKQPFTLPAGVQTVRAVAFSPDTGGESNVVTKTFDVTKSKKSSVGGTDDNPDDYGFLEDLKIIESHRKRRPNGFNRPTTQEVLSQLIVSDGEKSKKPGVLKNQWDKSPRSTPVNAEGKQGCLKSSPQRKENDPVNHNPQEAESVRPLDPTHHRSPAPFVSDQTAPLSRLQRMTDVVHCPHCLHVRSANPAHRFCGHCGQVLPKLPYPVRPEPVLDQLGTCRTCGSNVPLNLATCLVCEQSLRASPKERSHGTLAYRLCTTCGTPNPSELTSCLTCEAQLPTDMAHLIYPYATGLSGFGPIAAQPPVATTLPDKTTRPVVYLPCVHCRRENNPDARYCDWCGLETQIPPTRSSFGWLEYPSQPYRSNPSDMRQMVLQCNRCATVVSMDSKFCYGCGSPLEPPARNAIWTDQMQSRGDNDESLWSVDRSDRSVAKRTNPVIVSNAATQTVGLFYPSSADLRRQSSLTRTPSSVDTQLRDRVPLLTPVSPGRGYWRKQLDHIIAHLKVYTTNNPEFRSVIGEPRLGKLLTADFSETRGHATVLLTFTLPDSIYSTPASGRTGNRLVPRDPPVREPKQATVHASRVDADSYTAVSSHRAQTCRESAGSGEEPSQDGHSGGYKSLNSDGVDDDSPRSPNGKTKRQPSAYLDEEFSDACNGSPSVDYRSTGSKRRMPRGRGVKTSARSQRATSARSSRSGRKSSLKFGKKSASAGHHGEAGVALQRESKLTASDRSLIHLLTRATEPTAEEIRRLIEEGANPNCVTADGETPLVLAVHQRHEQAIGALIEAGAKPNAPGMSNGNTALHEAVLCGFDGVQMVNVLLKHGASPKSKNKRQETPHAIAMRMKCEPLIQLFLAHMGQMQLEQLHKHMTPAASVQPEKEVDEF